MNDANGRIVLPADIDADTQALINHLLKQLRARRLRVLLRQSYYDSKRAVKQVGTVVPPSYYKLGLALGWSAKSVDLLARRCNLDAFTWADGTLADIGGDDLFVDNHLTSEVNAGGIASLTQGPAFLINTAGADGEPDSLIHVADATEATGTWNRRRRALDDLLCVNEWDINGKPLSIALYLEGRTLVAERDRMGSPWVAEWQEHDYGLPVEVLAYKPTPKRPFGRSRITRPLMSLQDAAVRSLIRLEGHMDVYSFPELWMLGADLSAFKNADGTMMDIWSVRMGRIKGLPDDEDATNPRADVKQMPASDPTPHLADLNTLAKLAAREASLPDSALAITDVSNPTSAEAYDASQYELIAEAEGVADDWTPAVRRSFLRGLAIKNKTAFDAIPDEWKSIQPKWRDPRYLSRAAEADAGMKQLAAVPWLAESEVGLELLGLSDDQITRALADKRRAQGAIALQQIANSAQQLTGGAPSGDAG